MMMQRGHVRPRTFEGGKTYLISGHNMYLVPNERNRGHRWHTSSTGAMSVNGSDGSMGVPDFSVRMSRKRHMKGWHRGSMLNQVIPERVVYEETLLDLTTQGLPHDQAHNEAMSQAFVAWEKNQKLPQRARGVHYDPTWMLRAMYGGSGGPMSVAPFAIHPHAPTVENAQRAGQVPDFDQAPRIAPGNAVIGGLGTTPQDAGRTRQDNRARNLATGRALGTPERPGQGAIYRQYQSVDGQVYAIHVKNGDQSAPNAMRDLMLHCLFEQAKGGNAATVLLACKFRFPDATGNLAFDYEAVAAMYGAGEPQPEGPPTPGAVSNEGADFG